ncbi:threonine dehydrogenase [Rhizocola hellebori]|uniref:Threonine dehydrogenase n=1 Tax=Rhizocola hellebori TaxID=1392758 RepID=A0A8J3VKH8_9ACTN|nr:glucose 1-dehydrogenase [Rhizocola hellebori]GIH09058.1 threonine dehydrogenase [Rhizocola hellebori]
MQALMVTPRVANSAHLAEIPSPVPEDGWLLVRGVAIGVCGTDREIVAGDYGTPPPGHAHLVLGHESLGRVEQAPAASGFAVGDLVAGVVRRPDPVPCGACAQGEFDMCRNGQYTERGIKNLDGFASQWWTIEPGYAVKVPAALGIAGVLVEPTSVVAKAWDQIERIGARSWFDPKRVLVTGAGPIGLLAALLGVQRGLEVHVLDRATAGVKPEAVQALGATYHSDPVEQVATRLNPDIIIEATGAAQVVIDVISHNAPYGIVCLTGVSPSGRLLPLDAGLVNRNIVLDNDVVVGSVNAGLRHYEAAVQALALADPAWLARLLTRQVPLDRFPEALAAQQEDIKVVLTL